MYFKISFKNQSSDNKMKFTRSSHLQMPSNIARYFLSLCYTTIGPDRVWRQQPLHILTCCCGQAATQSICLISFIHKKISQLIFDPLYLLSYQSFKYQSINQSMCVSPCVHLCLYVYSCINFIYNIILISPKFQLTFHLLSFFIGAHTTASNVITLPLTNTPNNPLQHNSLLYKAYYDNFKCEVSDIHIFTPCFKLEPHNCSTK